MQKLIQNYKTGRLELAEIPFPQLKEGYICVKNYYSLISAGTEKTKIDTAKKNLIGKAKSRPDLVKQVIDKARNDGLINTWKTVNQRLNTPISLGYSSAGMVLEVKGDVAGLRQGDLVACGGDYANHAEIICVPKNLSVKIPNGVRLDHAAFATVGAIAMQGVRQSSVQIGEKVAVIGLGLIGLIVVQILKASGCQVIGIDLDTEKLDLSRKLGCHKAVLANDNSFQKKVFDFSDGYGVDACILTAGTNSNGPIEQAGEITREKGKVIILGAVGMKIPREPYYRKEIDIKLSRSYGPGRYDKNYEEKGYDYPLGYVRFTEQRNMASFLDLIKNEQILIDPIITHRFPIEDANSAYDLIQGDNKENYLGILLEYKRKETEIPKRVELHHRPLDHKIILGVIGAGNYATSCLLPLLKSNPHISLGSICTATGMTAIDVAKKFGFQSADSNVEQIFSESDAIMIATRHNEHAYYTLKALQKGKPVYCEKPLLIKQEELNKFLSLSSNKINGSIMVGFNRRFAPATEMIKAHFQSINSPKQILIRVNAGFIPFNHWIQDPDIGGGRIIGEACHFVDLVIALTNAIIKNVCSLAITKVNCNPMLWDDFTITLELTDGSIGTIVYTSVGDKAFPKEYIEVFSEGRIGIIKDFKSVELWSNGKVKQKKWSRQDKGQRKLIETWIKDLQKGMSPIPFHEIINAHQACLSAVKSIQNHGVVTI